MEPQLIEIDLPFTDALINASLRDLNTQVPSPSRHFAQTEEFFVKLAGRITVGSLPIHHDVRRRSPTREYLEVIRSSVAQVAAALPNLFEGLTYFFDPASILRPAFFRIYKYRNSTYLYLLRLDLAFRPAAHEVIDRGSNDRTPSYSTAQLVLESDFLPLDQVLVNDGKVCGFRVEQSVSQTWIGETGRGYHLQGIWIDRELTRFFSKLFTKPGVRSYPFFPFTCKYRAICHSVPELSEDGRRKSLPLLHRAREFLRPHMAEIEDALRAQEFDEKMPMFCELKEQVEAFWYEIWEQFQLNVYLNDDEQREFELVHGLV